MTGDQKVKSNNTLKGDEGMKRKTPWERGVLSKGFSGHPPIRGGGSGRKGPFEYKAEKRRAPEWSDPKWGVGDANYAPFKDPNKRAYSSASGG